VSEVRTMTLTERLWHGVHALSVLLLTLTGFQIHFPKSFRLFGSFQAAQKLHAVFGIILVLDLCIWAVYQLSSRRIRYFLPNREDLPWGVFRQGRYYLVGIFKAAEHPFESDGIRRKFNPLQKLAYFGVMGTLVPAQVLTGIVLLVHIDVARVLGEQAFRLVSFAHTLLCYAVATFLVSHVYLATTGRTPWAYFRTLVTGRAEH
jgi:thiosulfate reductase cytochrome b subunit